MVASELEKMTANLQSNKEAASQRSRGGQRRLGQSRFGGTRNAQLVPSDTESPPLSPARAERRPLRVEFALMEDEEKSSGGNSDERELSNFRNGAHHRFNQPRLSLLGRPLNYRQHRKDVRYRRLQARIYNFLERPKAWQAWLYHFSVEDSNNSIPSMPSFNSVCSSLYRHHRKTIPVLPQTHAEIDLTEEWTTASDDQPLLIFINDDDKKILAFSTSQQFQSLQLAGTWSVLLHLALSFGIRCISFMYIVHGVRTASRQTDAEIKGCFFHFTQAIWYKTQNLGLARLYKDDPSVQRWIRRAAALPLLPIDLVFALVLLCLVLSVLASIEDFIELLSPICEYMEVLLLVWIALELCLRMWSSGCRSRYQGCMGRLKFMRRPLCLIDVILLMSSLVSLVVGSTQEKFATSSLKGFRFFQILRLVRMDRRGGTWKLLGSVVWAHRQELLTTLYIGVLGLIFSSFFVYLAEKEVIEKDGITKRFASFADALWWGVVTLCTVGYGDVVPTTWGGKLIASFSAILGISFFALPAGILGSGFALKVQQQQRQKHLNRRRVPAAQLIQCLWRCYAADENSMSIATWKPHMVPCPSPTLERPWKNNASFVSRFSTRRRERSGTNSSQRENSSGDRSGMQSPMTPRQNSKKMHHSNTDEDVPDALNRSHLSLATGIAETRTLDHLPVKKENSVSSICKDSEEELDLSPRVQQLTDVHKRAIRSIRKMKYYVARRKFREALRPYDVKDVIEQYSAGHIDMLSRIKNLQGRLDQILGKAGSKNKDVYDSKQSLASRVVKVERSTEDIEAKLDLLVDMYKEDRRLLLQYLQTQMSSPGQTSTPPNQQPKPRPILVEKQFTSEPATPTTLSHHPVKPMQRNLSDLSQRIKKRVTYRCLSLNDPPPRLKNCTKNLMAPLTTTERLSVSHSPPPQSGLVIDCKGDNSCDNTSDKEEDYDNSYCPDGEYGEKGEDSCEKDERTPMETDPLLGDCGDGKDDESEQLPGLTVVSEGSSLALKSASTSTYSSEIDQVFSSPDDETESKTFDGNPSVNEAYVNTEINENTLDFHIQCETGASKYNNHC